MKRWMSLVGTFRTCRDSLAMSAHPGVKQTSRRKAATSVFDPQRTSGRIGI